MVVSLCRSSHACLYGRSKCAYYVNLGMLSIVFYIAISTPHQVNLTCFKGRSKGKEAIIIQYAHLSALLELHSPPMYSSTGYAIDGALSTLEC